MESTWIADLEKAELEQTHMDVEQPHYMTLTIDNMGCILPVSMVRNSKNVLKMKLKIFSRLRWNLMF